MHFDSGNPFTRSCDGGKKKKKKKNLKKEDFVAFSVGRFPSGGMAVKWLETVR